MTVTRPARLLLPAVLLTVGLAAAGCADPAEMAGAAPASQNQASTHTRTETPTAAASHAIDVVQTWLGQLRDGDTAAAQAGLGSWSARNAEPAGGVAGMASGLAEGMAAFGADGISWDAVPVPGHDEAFLVTAAGRVTREGTTETDARAWLVHPEDGRDVVEAFSPQPPEVVVPPRGEPLPSGAALEATLPVGELVVVLDGGLVTPAHVDADADGRVAVRLDGGWPAGQHVVTVASVPTSPSGEGPWSALAAVLEIR
jgi:hypothetical protein